MPAYLCHGFRWHRPNIRVFVVVQNLDDASPDWLVNPPTTRSLLACFGALFDFLPKGDVPELNDPNIMPRPRPPAPPVHLLEEYDHRRLDELSRPYAYVADFVTRIDLSASIFDVITNYEAHQRRCAAVGHRDLAMTGPHSDDSLLALLGGERGFRTHKQCGTGWLELLRDQLQRCEPVRWYIVVNNDEERVWERGSGEGGEEEGEEEEEEDDDDDREQVRRGLRLAFGHPDTIIDNNDSDGPHGPDMDAPPPVDRRPFYPPTPSPPQPPPPLLHKRSSLRPKTPASLRRLFSRHTQSDDDTLSGKTE